MCEERFKYFETTADIGIEVYSEKLNDAFINSALATMNLITDIDKIKHTTTRNITLEADDNESLLYDWITELLILLDSEFFIASEYQLDINYKENTYKLNATISGDIYDTTIYNYKTEVKAITYHNMLIEKDDSKYHIRFIVDL
ncbi:MAG: archease [Methanosphaera stadtmanae]|jgi:SHS2 domain-containing protein|nr:archease [Methanosphaera stadtmanae]